MDGKSLDVTKEKIEQLKQLFPEILTEGEIDWEKLRLTLGDDVNIKDERYVLNWAGKGDAFRALQTQTTATLAPAPDESINFDSTQNIFIEGENLEVLKVLQKSYYGKIKMIYIDPPYNTGNDSFIYPDKFSESREEYLRRIQAKDEDGYLLKEGMFRKNSKDSGHYHSNWLSMMYPRLFLARNLLTEQGLIFVNIDENEVHNLTLLMNEIFGEENFIGKIVWEKRYTRNNDAKLMSSVIDYILMYRKSEAVQKIREARTEKADSTYSNPDKDPRGDWTSVSYVSQRTKAQRPNLTYKIKNPITQVLVEHPTNAWKYGVEQHQEHVKENKLYWGPEGGYSYPRLKIFLSEQTDGMVLVNLWKYQETGTVDDGTKELDTLLGSGVFDYPKPTTLIKRMLKILGDEDSIVLDFFAGSGTTAQAVFEANQDDGGKRKFICVQLPELTQEESEAYKVGFKNISEIAKERIRRAIKKVNAENPMFAKSGQDLGFKVFKLKNSNFKLWRGDGIENSEQLEKQLELVNDPVRPEAQEQHLLTELLLKSGYLLTAKVEQRKVGKAHYWLVESQLAIALTYLDQTLVDSMLAQKPQQVIVLDSLFVENDPFKTNTQLQCKDAGIEFHSI
jgi:adenine-specific DNA-methyltransferase